MAAAPSRSAGRRAGVALPLAALTCLACLGLGWRLGTSCPAWLAQLQAAISAQPALLQPDQQAVLLVDGAAYSAIAAANATTAASFDWGKLPQEEVPKPLGWGSFTPTTRCDDTCARAKDGVCDEGRAVEAGQSQPVYCDLGTDCSDCTSYGGMDIVPSIWPEGGPVSHLTQGMQVKLFTRQTVTQPPFQMLYTDPEQDLDVSNYIHTYGVIESGITEIFRMVLEHNCVDPATGKRRLVLDVGANFGYFSVYAARLGCRVIAWEPVPMFRAFLHYVLSINGVAHLVEVRDRAVTELDGATIPMQVPRQGIWGTASIKGINQQGHQAPREVSVLTERVDSVVKQDVLLMKVDVEGFEPFVMKSAQGLFSRHTVENVVLEYNPGVAEHLPYTNPQLAHLITDMPRMLLGLLKQGYRIGMMLDHVAKTNLYTQERRFPPIPEITAAHLAYDLDDAEKYQLVHNVLAARLPDPYRQIPKGMLNCPPHQELMLENHEMWANCGRMPEDAHPKSVRIAFVFNANLWAARTDRLLKLSSNPPSLMALDVDPQAQWTTRRSESSVGMRLCNMVPPHTLVRNRCACSFLMRRQNVSASTQQACDREQGIVDRLLSTGEIKFATLPPAQL